LLNTIRRCQGQLAVLASGDQNTRDQAGTAARDLAAENRSLEVFLGGLQTLWHSSQPRRRKPKPRSGKRSRPDPFEPDVEQIEAWLKAEPMLRGKELLERLIQHNPERYGKRHLRTLQRRVRGYLLRQIEQDMEQVLDGRSKDQKQAKLTEIAVLPGVKRDG